MKLTHTPDGKTYLHIWRSGINYELQKGRLFRNEWTSVYFSRLPQPPSEKDVLFLDVREPFPCSENVFDAVYAFHILEHLTPAEGKAFLSELLRLLKPGGICRLSTPDLESMVRAYLDRFQECLDGPDQSRCRRFRWAQLELFDQIVRDKSGGCMWEAVRRGDFDEAYMRERYGDVCVEFQKPLPGADKIFKAEWQGDPRQTFEANKWLYDRLSLRLALEKAGFQEFAVRSFRDSAIPGWERYDLDRSNQGDWPIEPSLYVEARKPQ